MRKKSMWMRNAKDPEFACCHNPILIPPMSQEADLRRDHRKRKVAIVAVATRTPLDLEPKIEIATICCGCDGGANA